MLVFFVSHFWCYGLTGAYELVLLSCSLLRISSVSHRTSFALCGCVIVPLVRLESIVLLRLYNIAPFHFL